MSTQTWEQTPEYKKLVQGYSARKARRFDKASQYAQVLARIPSNGSVIEIRRAMRSRGHASGYKQVPQYWALEYKDGKLTHGRSLTLSAYQQARVYAFEHHSIQLPQE